MSYAILNDWLMRFGPGGDEQAFNFDLAYLGAMDMLPLSF